MPDEGRDSHRRMKHSRHIESNSDDLERKRKKHKRHKTHDESEVEIVRSREKQATMAEVIEIHGSSSEEGEIEDSVDSAGSSPKMRRKHSHSRKHRREHTERHEKYLHGEKEKSHSSHSERKHSKTVISEKESNKGHAKKHKRKEKQKPEEDYRKRRAEERVLTENGRIKEETKEDVDEKPSLHRHRVKEERERHRSPLQVKREAGRRSSPSPQRRHSPGPQRRHGPSPQRGNSREDRQRGEDKRHQRNRRPGGPSHREDGDNYEWGQGSSGQAAVKTEPTEKEKPDFKLSGKLTEDRNTFNGVVIKYSEPPEARMPKKRWRLYQFKGEEALPTLYIHRQSAYLIGRDRKVADLPVDHPSCSKQHAALQYRLVTFERPNGTTGKQIRLYVIDLESANGTFINGKKIESKKYVELMEKDVIKFGFSSREYVLLHEQSKDDESSEED